MSNGNGTSQVTIDRVEMGAGWVYFEPGKNKPSVEELPSLLNRAMSDWLAENPSHVVRTTLGIVANGVTVGIHVWYDESNM